MDLKDLKDYQADEERKAAEYFRVSLDKMQTDGQVRPTFLDLVPEYRTKVDGKAVTNVLAVNPYPYTGLPPTLSDEISRTISQAVILQLPFFDSVIFMLLPSKDERKFKSIHGLGLGHFMALVREGRILPVLWGEPADYASCECMDPILEEKPPSLCIRYEPLEALLLVSNMRKPMFDQSVLRTLRDASSNFPELAQVSETLTCPADSVDLLETMTMRSRDELAHYIEELIISGYSDVVKESLKAGRSVFEFSMSWNYALIAARYLSLGGIASLPSEIISALQRSKVVTDVVKAFPLDVSRVLVEKFNLLDFRDVDYDRILSIDGESGKARRALYELDLAVRRKEVQSALDRAHSLRQVMQETNEAIRAIVERKERIAPVVPIVLGVVGGIVGALASSGIGLLACALGGGLSGIPVSGIIADSLSKWNQESHVVALYELGRSKS